MLAHNILNPQMVRYCTFSGHGLGLYYMTKERLSTPEKKILGQDLTFYSAEEVNIALNEGRLELNARVRIRAKDFNDGRLLNNS
jgi:DNA-directed RNA polymerase subunit beta'